MTDADRAALGAQAARLRAAPRGAGGRGTSRLPSPSPPPASARTSTCR